jgi:hypothetical protein
MAMLFREVQNTLLNKVAGSTVIFFPIFQLGCFKALATFTSFSLSTGLSCHDLLILDGHGLIASRRRYNTCGYTCLSAPHDAVRITRRSAPSELQFLSLCTVLWSLVYKVFIVELAVL